MNTPILTSQDAFSAMMAGKNILCRAIGKMLDFNDLDQFPATIFAQPGYEFCIKIDTMVLAGIEFTVPLTLDEIEEGQDLFVVNTYGPSIYVVDFSCPALTESINNGFVQRDAENAKLQLRAMSKLMGRELLKDLTVVRLGGDKPKTTRKAKAKAPVAESVKVTAIGTDSAEIAAVGESVSANTAGIAITEVADTVAVEESLIAESKAESNIVDFNPKTLSADELKRLTLEAESSIYKSVDEEEVKRQQLLSDLLKNIINAQTPAVANAQIRYARDWTVEQQVPLHKAISKRLCELAPVEHEMPPTLMDRIKSASDLTALDILEVDVGARSPEMQPKFMAEIVKRRRVLEGVV